MIEKGINNTEEYLIHLLANIKVSFKCLILSIFHIIHGLLPIKITSHEYWKIK